ncbi:hypothetical protein [Streptomyces sp. NPDC006477]|uniref:hypothetical protein n=1 Tax=Streptomyces sp. NPDC006477 TaxID=3364747 RepID=UPI0036CA2A1E
MKREDMDAVTRVVSDSLDDYLGRKYGKETSDTSPEWLIEALAERGYHVVAAGERAPQKKEYPVEPCGRYRRGTDHGRHTYRVDMLDPGSTVECPGKPTTQNLRGHQPVGLIMDEITIGDPKTEPAWEFPSVAEEPTAQNYETREPVDTSSAEDGIQTYGLEMVNPGVEEPFAQNCPRTVTHRPHDWFVSRRDNTPPERRWCGGLLSAMSQKWPCDRLIIHEAHESSDGSKKCMGITNDEYIRHVMPALKLCGDNATHLPHGHCPGRDSLEEG